MQVDDLNRGQRPSLAIIGSGISGMGAAYYLRHDYDITVFEKEKRPGGHTNTITVEEDHGMVPVDTGFIVFNHATYPNLLALFTELQIQTHPASMGFSVWNRTTDLQYCGSGLSGLFAMRRNLLRPSYYRFLLEMNRFNEQAAIDLESGLLDQSHLTMQEYLNLRGFSREFNNNYILPMSSAIWSTPVEQMMDFPAITLIRFFKNHGLLGLNANHQWYSVEGGSRTYIDRIRSLLNSDVRCAEPVLRVERLAAGGVALETSHRRYSFDAVIMAGHAPDMLRILSAATDLERQVLSQFRYHPNRAILHTDESVMPPLRRIWSAWNHKIDGQSQATIYHMNQLQRLPAGKNYFVSINEFQEVREENIICQIDYEHPLFDQASVRAQTRFDELNQDGPVYFAGAYSGHGFHEDGLRSALKIVKRLANRTAATEAGRY